MKTETQTTVNVPGVDGAAKTSVWQIVVSRCRLICVWMKAGAPPKIIDWSLVMPPVVTPSVSAASLYYALFHSALTRPIMMARFWILQKGVHSLDISETHDAMQHHKLEAHLLYKATQRETAG